MKRIFKYEVPITKGISLVAMPKGAQIVSAGFQVTQTSAEAIVGLARPTVQVWAVVDPAAPLVDRALAAIGTGWELPAQVNGEAIKPAYVGAVMADPFVWHVLDFGEAS
jgi:hypothetical protein